MVRGNKKRKGSKGRQNTSTQCMSACYRTAWDYSSTTRSPDPEFAPLLNPDLKPRPVILLLETQVRLQCESKVLCWDDVGRWSLETLRGLIKGEIHLNKCSFLKACILFPSCCPFSCLWVSSLIRLLCSRYVLKGHFHLTFFFVLQIPK